ncbi:hypothetical protein CRM22_009378 [Opisthorchis felineus]|uniref:CID domain-containing protein n=1 Tax=Opisthorchis felineus TaxID=147828 RepID=A0A4S2LE28_OPIFE|nr:hypothetical protein CRM22_009378 [Opisthorchis felineus]
MQPEQLLDAFKKDLDNLKDNDKYKINALTIFARDHKDSDDVAQGIVTLTTNHVHAIPSGLKLIGLYVIDSIVKNVGAPFRKLYTSTIVDAFVHSFQAIRDEKGRLKLYNLRTTWKDIFPNTRMYELDIRVREHDPAWPLLAVPPESKAAFRSLPNIPKIQNKTENKDAVITETSSPLTASISSSRDPRLNRKRKSPTTSAPAPAEDFLIDRSGDQKMEAVARKHGKQEENVEPPKKPALFGGQDLDMRPQNAPPPPVRSGVWSEYIDKHAEVVSRREVKDVDMRVSNAPVRPESLESRPPVSCTILPTPTTVVAAPVLPSSVNLTRHFTDSRSPTAASLVPNEPLAFTVPTENQNFVPHDTNVRVLSHPPPPHTQILPLQGFQPRVTPRFDKDPSLERLPIMPEPFNQSSRPAVRGPPIRGPVWRVEIYGFPDMVNIGVDPRMLSLVPHPKPPRRITIDGRQYSLLLDRVQPLIMVGDQVHAVRFRCEFATVLIDGRCFTIPGTGFTKVMVGWRPYQAYLGGPGHELVIDGRPHTIPLSSQLTYVTVGYHSVGVKFVGDLPRNVNVLPPIPPRLLKWAGQGLFGSPRDLRRAPLNPLVELARLAEGRPAPRKPNMMQDNSEFRVKGQTDAEPPVGFGPSPVTNVEQPLSSSESTPAVTDPKTMIDVHALFQKLVKAGIVSDTSQPPPELQNYSWERFKHPCTSETDNLYTGHQCSQCGLRFQSDLSPEFASHLDYHYMKNSSDESERRSRNFYQGARYWLLSETVNDGGSQFDSETPLPDLQESKCPAFADPSRNVCAVCYEKFDVIWDHEEEEWMLRDAVLVQEKVYHPICQEDAGKEFTPDNAVAHDMKEVPPPLSELKGEPATDLVSENHETKSPVDENAFVCEDHHDTTQIPGLSPVPSPEETNVTVKEEPSETKGLPLKSESREIIPVHEHISADPLAALTAVLRGGVSSLVQPHSS